MALFLASTAASAQDANEPPTDTRPAYPDEIVKRPLTLPKGYLEVGAKLAPDIVGPASFARFPLTPFAWYGIVDRVSVGLSTDSSLCLGAECPGRYTAETKRFNDLVLDSKVLLLEDKEIFKDATLAIAFHGGIDFPSFTDPFAFGPRVGALGRLRLDSFAIVFDPSVYVGLSSRDRDLTTTTAGAARTISIPVNRDVLRLPLSVVYQLLPTLALSLNTGMTGQLTGYGLGHTFQIPVGIGASYTIAHRVDVFGSFTFPELVGAPGVTHERLVFQIGGAVRFDTQKPRERPPSE